VAGGRPDRLLVAVNGRRPGRVSHDERAHERTVGAPGRPTGSFSDSEVVTTQFLLAEAAKYLQPGVINLGHANHRPY
jgi:hypothetical protein